jgi:hypothetical protein
MISEDLVGKLGPGASRVLAGGVGGHVAPDLADGKTSVLEQGAWPDRNRRSLPTRKWRKRRMIKANRWKD